MYVDDMLKAGKDRAMILEMKEKIHENFSMKELENARHILRLRIERTESERYSRSPKVIMCGRCYESSTWRIRNQYGHRS